MCGIAGFIKNSSINNTDIALMDQMLKIQHHRGPDNTGRWSEHNIILGHNRLSIIDLQEGAHQPMFYDNQRYVLTYNGEVYNYVEIKQELVEKGYQFATNSDSEVIIAAYKEWGEDCVKQFIGMWAFAIYDRKEKNLFCSRDRFGIKPFHFIFQQNEFYFASEIKTLKPTPHFSNDLSVDMVNMFLHMNWYNYQDQTLFSKVQILEPGHNLTFKNGSILVKQYWSLSDNPVAKSDKSEKEKFHEFRELFLNSIKLHNRSDLEVGVCLSGGIDSSAIASATSFLNPKELKAFTIYYEGRGKEYVDERKWVEEVIMKYPNIKTHYFSPSREEILENIDKCMYHFDIPIPGSAVLSQFFVMQLAAQNGIKVLLDGQGADETFAGYLPSYYRQIGQNFAKFRFLKGLRSYFNFVNYQDFDFKRKVDVLLKSIVGTLYSESGMIKFQYKNQFDNVAKSKTPPFELINYPGTRLDDYLFKLITQTSIQFLLHNEDRNAMAFSIESRVPFLDHRIVEYGFSLQDDEKLKGNRTKNIVRDSLEGILPESIQNRVDKKAFFTPGEVSWLRGELKHLLDDDFSNLSDLTNINTVKKVISNYKNGQNKNAELVWRLAMLNKWMA